MIRIAITPAAFDAIAATLPLGSVGYEPQRDRNARSAKVRKLAVGTIPQALRAKQDGGARWISNQRYLSPSSPP